MKNEDLEKCLDDCIRILDENVDILSDIEFELEQQKEDELVPGMRLTDLIDMTEDIADSSRLKRAELNFMQRHLERSSQ